MSWLSGSTVGRAMLHGLFGLLTVGVIAKFVSLDQFATDLLTWDLIPSAAASALSIVVPSLELTLGAAWFTGVGRRQAVWGYLGLVVAFTAMLALQLAAARPPTCGCFGALARFDSALEGAWFGLGRKLVLLVLWAAGAVLTGVVRVGRRWGRRKELGARLQAARGFTLIEMLIVLALVGVLTALILPSLRGVRRGAQVGVSLSNLRQHAATMAAYAGENAEGYPYFTDPYAVTTYIQHQGVVGGIHYFELHLLWNFWMADDYYGGDHAHGSFAVPWSSVSGPTEYYYADCFIARPEFWNPSTRIGRPQWLGTRESDVVFPSLKGLIRERHSWIERGTGEGVEPGPESPFEAIRFARADGSAGGLWYTEFRGPISTGVGSWPWTVSYIGYGLPIMHTYDGVRGRDVK